MNTSNVDQAMGILGFAILAVVVAVIVIMAIAFWNMITSPNPKKSEQQKNDITSWAKKYLANEIGPCGKPVIQAPECQQKFYQFCDLVNGGVKPEQARQLVYGGYFPAEQVAAAYGVPIQHPNPIHTHHHAPQQVETPIYVSSQEPPRAREETVDDRIYQEAQRELAAFERANQDQNTVDGHWREVHDPAQLPSGSRATLPEGSQQKLLSSGETPMSWDENVKSWLEHNQDQNAGGW